MGCSHMDKGTTVRTVVLTVALFNQVLAIFGKSPLPFSQQEIEHGISTLFTVVASLIAWYKNNYITTKGKKQKTILKESGML